MNPQAIVKAWLDTLPADHPDRQNPMRAAEVIAAEAKPYGNVPTEDLVELRYAMEQRPATPDVIAVCLRISAELRRRADNGEDVVTLSRTVVDRNIEVDARIAAERERLNAGSSGLMGGCR